MTPEHGLPDEVIAALKRGNKIEAIKLLRTQNNLGLKEAKDIVDASGIEPDDNSAPGQVRTSGGLVWIAALALLAVAGWYVLR